MSQAKVESHNKEKREMKEQVKRRKVYNLLLDIATVLICLAAVAWVGFSVYTRTQENAPIKYNYVPATNAAITEYISTVD